MERCSARGRSLRIRTPVHTDRFLKCLGFLARRLDPESYQLLCQKCCEWIVEDAKHAAQRRTLRFIINDIAASPEMTQSGT
jgi:hypothetical protein